MTVDELASVIASDIERLYERLEESSSLEGARVRILITPEDAYDRMPVAIFVESTSGLQPLSVIDSELATEIDRLPSLLDEERLPYETEQINDAGVPFGTYKGVTRAIARATSQSRRRTAPSSAGIEVAMHDDNEVIRLT